MTQVWVVRLKRTAVIVAGLLVCCIALMWGFFAVVFPSSNPPTEKKLIGDFYAHRKDLEGLRDMLWADKQLLTVANWGVETTLNQGPHHVQPGGDFPVIRYNQYLTLLKQCGCKSAFRIERGGSELIGISLWATGWGADTRHVDVYWTDHAPSTQVASLDEYYKTPKPRHPVYRHIDANWYLFADW
jgi:hypothetical protein